MARKRAVWTEHEAAIVDQVSADAAAMAGDEADTVIFRDIESVRPVRRPQQAESFGIARPSVKDLLNREDDGFIGHIKVGVVRGAGREGRRLAVILEPFAFVHRIDNVRLAAIAPVRYETDFASIPPWAQAFISPFGVHAEAAVIHDWLYAIGTLGDEHGRYLADAAFREALRHLGVGWATRTIMYNAVRAGGKTAYGRPEEFRFRHLADFSPVDPPPARDPYLNTVAITVTQGANDAVVSATPSS